MTKPKQIWRCQKCSCTGHAIPRATPRSKLCAWCADELRKAGQRWCPKGRHGVAVGGWARPDSAMCRKCQRATNVAYRETHRAEMIAQSQAYHAEHRAEILEQNKLRYQAQRAEILEKKRVYYAERRELLKAKQRAYRPHRPQASREKEKQRQRAKQHALTFTFSPPDESMLSVSSGYGHRTKTPFVIFGLANPTETANPTIQMTSAQARTQAHYILEAADAAESDGFIVEWLRGNGDLSEQQIGTLLE